MFATTAKSATASRWAGLGVVLALHAAVIGALLQHQPVRDALASVAPIMVSLIAPPKVAVAPSPKPPIDLPKPKPHPVRQLPDPPPLCRARARPARAGGPPRPPPRPARGAEPPAPPARARPRGPPGTPPELLARVSRHPRPGLPRRFAPHARGGEGCPARARQRRG